MRGHVPTPSWLVDLMVEKLFRARPPQASETLLDPGCGTGAFIEGVLRFCDANSSDVPKCLGIESNPKLAHVARERLQEVPEVEIVEEDYLGAFAGPADYVIGNPPYVGISDLSEDEKDRFRGTFDSAVGRFDLYLLFLEQSIGNLREGGRLCFVTPEKYEYVQSAEPLRELLGKVHVEEIHHIDEDSFPGVVAYPAITVLEKRSPETGAVTSVKLRDGTARDVTLPRDGRAWSGTLRGWEGTSEGAVTLEDVCVRVSCGIATGADGVFVLRAEDIPEALERWTYPTLAGRHLGLPGQDDLVAYDLMIIPYSEDGTLLPETELNELGTYLGRSDNRRKLEGRSCVKGGRKPWYAFHDNAPLPEILRPKIVCKDIAPEPKFWLDDEGRFVPRHSVYYIVPERSQDAEPLCEYLNSPQARAWLEAHCQRAANGFFRLQSSVLKELPLPPKLAHGLAVQTELPRA